MAMQRKLWSLNALATELQLDRRTMAKRLERIPPAEVKQIGDRSETRWYLADVIGHLSRRPAMNTATKEKARLDKLRADQVEFDLQVKRGEYAPIEALTFAIGEFASRACSIFDAIPKRVKNSLPTLRAREIKIIQREIDKAKQAASEIQVNFDTATK